MCKAGRARASVRIGGREKRGEDISAEAFELRLSDFSGLM